MVKLVLEQGFVLVNYCFLIWVTNTSIRGGLRGCLRSGERKQINTAPLSPIDRDQ